MRPTPSWRPPKNRSSTRQRRRARSRNCARNRDAEELEGLAHTIRRSGEDKKWRELATLLGEIFTPAAIAKASPKRSAPDDAGVPVPKPKPSPHQKLVIFTEHRDTLNYLQQAHRDASRPRRSRRHDPWRHGPRGADEGPGGLQTRSRSASPSGDRRGRRRHQPSARASDGQLRPALEPEPVGTAVRTHSPHRADRSLPSLEPGAEETREGDVYRRLLEKLEQARVALGGQVFDVLGKLQFEGRPCASC